MLGNPYEIKFPSQSQAGSSVMQSTQTAAFGNADLRLFTHLPIITLPSDDRQHVVDASTTSLRKGGGDRKGKP